MNTDHYIYHVGKNGGLERRAVTESPIEEILMDALLKRPLWQQKTAGDLTTGQGHYFTPQYDVGVFRTDFMMTCRQYVSDGIPPKAVTKQFAVECDGHDFHERTKQQIQNDKRRDRYFNMMCIPVIRFTGSEIYKNADRCAAEIERIAVALMAELLRAREV